MRNKLIKYALLFVSIVFSVTTTIWLLNIEHIADRVKILNYSSVINYFVFILLFGIIYYIIIYFLVKYAYKWIKEIAETILSQPTSNIIFGTVGFIVGIILAFLISRAYTFIQNNVFSTILAAITYIVFGYLGIVVASKRFSELPVKIDVNKALSKKNNLAKNSDKHSSKVLDTSAIIDGRIAEICKTGFVEGDLYVPEFVLKELRHIADSEDDLTRTKGRRGFDIIESLKETKDVNVIITDKDYLDSDEVDLKLLLLAKEIGASVVTTDYNLNKVASLQNIKVLNVNDLSNAVKPNAIPGETFEIEIIKRGKEQNQGVAYLSDGTMIVIESAADKVGQKHVVEVTSILQTPAGRMIFAKIKE